MPRTKAFLSLIARASSRSRLAALPAPFAFVLANGRRTPLTPNTSSWCLNAALLNDGHAAAVSSSRRAVVRASDVLWTS